MSCESSSGLPQIGRCCSSVCPEHTGLVPIESFPNWKTLDIPYWESQQTFAVVYIYMRTNDFIYYPPGTQIQPNFRLMHGAYEFQTELSGSFLWDNPNETGDENIFGLILETQSFNPTNADYSTFVLKHVLIDQVAQSAWGGINGIFTVPCSGEYIILSFRMVYISRLLQSANVRLRIRRVGDTFAP